MDHGGEAARPTTVVESTELVMAGAVHGGGEAHIHTGTFDSQLLHRDIFNGQFAAVYHNSDFPRHVRTAAGCGELFVAVFHGEPGPGMVVGDFWRQPGPGDEVLVAGLQLPDPEGVVPVHDNYGHYQLQPRPGARRGEVHLLPDGVGAVYDNFGYRVLQLPRPGVGRGDVLVNLLPDGVGVVYDNHAWQFRPGAGRGEVIANLLTDAAGAAYGLGNFAQEILPCTRHAEGNVRALHGPSIGLGYDGMVCEYLSRLLAFVGIGACSVAVNRLAAGPGSPVVAFQLFALLLGSLFLVILHVLRV